MEERARQVRQERQERAKRARQARKAFEAMNLIDDFLMNEVIGHETYGKKVIDYFLQVVLGQKIEVHNVQVQKVMTGGDNEKRGIRLDIKTKISLGNVILANGFAGAIHDEDHNASTSIEMHKDESNSNPYQKYDLRRRSRLSQGMIDTDMLETSSGFGDLDDVLIITCTPFDLFERNRYIYTFTNMCLEDNSLLLEDGAYRIFLNTGGVIGGTGELRDLLRFTEKSSETNATNESLKDIHNIIMRIKKSKKARKRHMCVWERLERERDKGFDEGSAKEREKAEAEIAKLKEEHATELADKDAVLADKDAEIAMLKSKLAQIN